MEKSKSDPINSAAKFANQETLVLLLCVQSQLANLLLDGDVLENAAITV